jgi:hypothetical protein
MKLTCMKITTVTHPLCTAIALVALIGCGSSNQAPKEGGGTPKAKEGLVDIVEMLKYLETNKQKPPTKLADIAPIDPIFPGAFIVLSNKTVEFVWGAGLDANGGANVLAYEKIVETEGGWVLMQDGTVKQMKPDEFKAAPKAKGK